MTLYCSYDERSRTHWSLDRRADSRPVTPAGEGAIAAIPEEPSRLVHNEAIPARGRKMMGSMAEAHDLLDRYLVRVDEAGWKTALKEVSAVRDKALKLQIWRALLERLALWRETDPQARFVKSLHDLLNAIEKWSLHLTEEDLRSLLRETADLTGIITPYSPMPHLMAYVEAHGLTPALAQAVDEFAGKARQATYTVNQMQWQLLLSRLDMLAWRDEWNDVDAKRCCTERIRIDFRQMQGAERERWRKILHSIDGDQGGRAAPRWLERASAIVEEMPADAFASRMLDWLAPLRRGTTARLSRAGSHVLRALIWIAVPRNDARLMASIAEISEVRFTPRPNGVKILCAAADAVGSPRSPLPHIKVPTFDEITAKGLNAVLSAQAWGGSPDDVIERIRFEGAVIHVRGDLDRYRIHLETGEAFRESDGMHIEVDLKDSEPLRRVLPFVSLGGAHCAELIAEALLLARDSDHRHAIRPYREGR